MLRKDVCTYDYINRWERFSKTSFPHKTKFDCVLILKGITDEGNEYAKRVWKEFKLKNLSDYHDLYVQYDTLLLADVFENFLNKCIEIYRFDSIHFLSAPKLAW